MLQRVGNRAVVLGIRVSARLASLLQRSFVVSLLQGVRNRCVVAELAPGIARLANGPLVKGLLQRIGNVDDLNDVDVITLVKVLGVHGRVTKAGLQPLLAMGAVGMTDALGAWPTLGRGHTFAPRRLAAGFLARAALAHLALRPRDRLITAATHAWVVATARTLALPAWSAQAGQAAQQLDIILGQINPDAAPQTARQHHRAVADSDQPADGQAHGVEQLANFAIAALGDDHAVPMVDPLAAAVFDALEGGVLTLDRDALEQARARLFFKRAEHTHRVLAFDAEARMHQLIGQLARGREQQQAFGVDVQAPDRLPLAVGQARQATEHRRTLLRVVMADDFTGGLVVGDHARRQRRNAHAHRLAVDGHAVAPGDALPGMRRLLIHRDALVDDHLLEVTARADPGLRQHLLQLRRLGVGGEHATRRVERSVNARARLLGRGSRRLQTRIVGRTVAWRIGVAQVGRRRFAVKGA